MSNYSFHPYLRWLQYRSQGDGAGFDIDQDRLSPQTAAPHTVNFSAPESEAWFPPVPLIGLAGFVPEQPNEVPGFRAGLRNDAPGFNLNETDLRPERSWPEGMATPAPEYPDVAQNWTLPPGVENPDLPTPAPLPGWLHDLSTMPVPPSLTAFDPQTARRAVPHEPLTNWTRSYPTVDQNVRRTGDASYIGSTSPSSAKMPHGEQWPFSDMLARLANVNAGPGTTAAQQADPQLTPKATAGSPWPQSRTNAWPYAQVRGVERQIPAVMTPQPTPISLPLPVRRVADSNFVLANAGDADVQRAQQEKPLPQDQPRQPIVTPRNAGLSDWQSSIRIPAKPGLEMPDLERATEQELARFIDEYRRTAADLMDELASAITRLGDRFYHDSILKPRDDLARLAQRFEDDPVNTILSVLNSFPQTRVEGGFAASFAAVFTILANAARGLAFERAVIDALNAARYATDVKKNTSKIGVQGLGRSIPDLLHKGITEIKSSVEINNSVQLRVQATYARIIGVPFNLIVSPATTRISQTVREAVLSTGGTIQRFNPETGTFTRIL